MAVSSVSSYSPMFNYDDWVNKAKTQSADLEKRLGINTDETSSTSSTSSSSSTSSTSGTSSYSASSVSTSSFLLSYKQALTDLESASAKLQVGSKDNVYSKYESALEALSKADTEDAKKAAQEKVDKAREDIVSAMNDFADKYNSTVSLLQSNSNRSDGAARQLSSLQRALPTEGALRSVGMKVNTSGKLEVDDAAVTKALTDGRYNHVKETVGGQYGIAQRMGSRASGILDSSIDTVVGSSRTSSASSTSSGAVSDLLSSSDSDSMSAYFASFANFAKSGAYNLSNYYAVGMLLNTLV